MSDRIRRRHRARHGQAVTCSVTGIASGPVRLLKMAGCGRGLGLSSASVFSIWLSEGCSPVGKLITRLCRAGPAALRARGGRDLPGHLHVYRRGGLRVGLEAQ